MKGFKYGFFGCLGVAAAMFLMVFGLGFCALANYNPSLPSYSDSPVTPTAPTVTLPIFPLGASTQDSYSEKMLLVLQDVTATVGEFNDRWKELVNQSDAVSKAKLDTAVSTLSSKMMDASFKMAMLTPPAALSPFHTCITEGIDLMNQAAGQLSLWLAMGDTDKTNDALEVYRAGMEQFSECKAALPTRQ